MSALNCCRTNKGVKDANPWDKSLHPDSHAGPTYRLWLVNIMLYWPLIGQYNAGPTYRLWLPEHDHVIGSAGLCLGIWVSLQCQYWSGRGVNTRQPSLTLTLTRTAKDERMTISGFANFQKDVWIIYSVSQVVCITQADHQWWVLVTLFCDNSADSFWL